ncbi:type I-E CRISPR-associated protein Cas5/CasD [Streptomyces sp. NPDC047097]|uniref:type I-E CRISPR-associated protein Cas5/CasD n=1 Tax=Streptomyces sp. NPDC047097 TaxID=3155260 RepID=UPI0033D66184
MLTLRLAGPLQSWGSSARFTRRTTESAPTKSGVIGLLAAAAGIERGDDERLAPLAALRFGVRVDQPGERLRDFHTAHHGVSGKSMPLTERFYLADAVFVAAVEGDPALLTTLHAAVRDPVYLPFLGRRSCPPSHPVDIALHQGTTIQDALDSTPWQASPWYRERHRDQPTVSLEVLREATATPAEPALTSHPPDTWRDQPLSFSAAHRLHTLRTVVRDQAVVPNPNARTPTPRTAASPTLRRHDPFDAFEDAYTDPPQSVPDASEEETD